MLLFNQFCLVGWEEGESRIQKLLGGVSFGRNTWGRLPGRSTKIAPSLPSSAPPPGLATDAWTIHMYTWCHLRWSSGHSEGLGTFRGHSARKRGSWCFPRGITPAYLKWFRCVRECLIHCSLNKKWGRWYIRLHLSEKNKKQHKMSLKGSTKINICLWGWILERGGRVGRVCADTSSGWGHRKMLPIHRFPKIKFYRLGLQVAKDTKHKEEMGKVGVPVSYFLIGP